MPHRLVRSHVARFGSPLLESDIRKLAREFEVSEQAMTIRLTVLGLIQLASTGTDEPRWLGCLGITFVISFDALMLAVIFHWRV